MRRGQSLVVWAISEGLECVREVDAYPTGQASHFEIQGPYPRRPGCCQVPERGHTKGPASAGNQHVLQGTAPPAHEFLLDRRRPSACHGDVRQPRGGRLRLVVLVLALIVATAPNATAIERHAPTVSDSALGAAVGSDERIADLAFDLDYDLERMFRFVADEIRYEPYAGILRGAVGALDAGAGNSVDKSLLLAALLDESVDPPSLRAWGARRDGGSQPRRVRAHGRRRSDSSR